MDQETARSKKTTNREPEGAEKLSVPGLQASDISKKTTKLNANVTPVLQTLKAKEQSLLSSGPYEHRMEDKTIELWFILHVIYKFDDKYEPFLDDDQRYTVDLLARSEDMDRDRGLWSASSIEVQITQPDRSVCDKRNQIKAVMSVPIEGENYENYYNFFFDRPKDVFLTLAITPIKSKGPSLASKGKQKARDVGRSKEDRHAGRR